MHENGVLNAAMQPKTAFVVDRHSADDVARAMIGSKQKEPFYIFEMDAVYERIHHFKRMMPRVQIFYAMKANDWDFILKLAASQGLGFDCASPGEISKILKLGICPLSIIYAIPTKTADQMIFARESGVKHTTFDSSYELKKIKQYWPEANLLLRIRVDGDSTYKLGEKFGCGFDTEAIELLEEAASLGLAVVGVAFHVGSACYSFDSHAVGLKRARALFDHEARAGRRLTIVDIGGGFLSSRTDCIDEVSLQVNEALAKYFPDPSVQVIAEPGRYLVDSSATLYNSINNIRRITKNGKSVTMIYLNDGLHGTLRYIEPWHTVEKLKRTPKIDEEDDYSDEVILWGPTCDSTDRVMEHQRVRLPKCAPFDWLVFRTQGAYSYSWQGPFSCVDIPRMRAVISLKLWLFGNEGTARLSMEKHIQLKSVIFTAENNIIANPYVVTRLQNIVKSSPAFKCTDFLLDPNISTPVPSTIPVIPKKEVTEELNTNSLMTI